MAKLKKSCKFVKNYFFSMKIIHAHLKYIWNKSTKNLKETLKALRGVDFTKFMHYQQLLYIRTGQEMAMLKNDLNLSKFTFSVL